MKVQVNINGQIVPCNILSMDSDPSCSVWVVEVNNPDQDHYVSRSQIVEGL